MKRLLLVGWDSADWKVIKPLMDEGMMPNLRGLTERGVMGNMATMYPMYSPMLWTTIATGKRPFEHGIHGFSEPDPSGAGVRPITNVSRTCRALWNITSLMGMKANVVGWWPSHPVEPINGVMVSDFFARAHHANDQPWPVTPRSVHPERLVEPIGALRVHPQDLDGDLVSLFMPKLFDIPPEEQEKNRRLSTLCKEIAECTTICNVAEAAMRFEPWRLTCAYFASIDHFSHAFMNFNPPKLDWVSQEDYDLYHEVVRSAYIYHDILLGRLLQQTDEQTTVIVLSDHGFHSDHLRPINLPDEPAGPAEQHRHYGIFVAAGPGIKQDELVFGATLLNVCPTVLACMDLPIGEDMEGGVLDIFEDRPAIEYLPSWEDVEGEDGMHPEGTLVEPGDARESLQQLIELGYVDALPENVQQAVEETTRELKCNLARAYMEASLQVEAAPILEELFDRWPNEFRFGIALINCYLALGQPEKAKALLERVTANKLEDMEVARKEFEAFQEEHKEAFEKARAGDSDAFPEALQHKLRKLRARCGSNPVALAYLQGTIAAALKDNDGAITVLEQARKVSPGDLRVLLKLGDTYLAARRARLALPCYEQALKLDPENASAWLGIAKASLRSRAAEATARAIESARKSVGLIFYNPMAHFVLGEALLRTGDVDAALTAWKQCVKQNPNFPEAWLRMARLHEVHRGASPEARECRRLARDAKKRLAELKLSHATTGAVDAIPEVPMPANTGSSFDYDPANTAVVVSGLPRSGTSMLMQMLAAGGLQPISDGHRNADDDNPLGYYEDLRVKALATNNAWLDEAAGKAVKIVAPLIPHLKPGLRYKVVFLWRRLEEVLRSQETMLRRGGHSGGRDAAALARVYTVQLRNCAKLLQADPNTDVLYLDYAQAVAEPARAASEINHFLGNTLDEAAMRDSVRPELRRQRADGSTSP